MNMMKWLRTHSKQIMVVTVLFAMFSFVGGSALVSILAPKQYNKPFAIAFGDEITDGDLFPIRRDLEVLERLFIPWRFNQPDMGAEHWYLLGKEAERAGIRATDEEAEDHLNAQMQFLQQQGFPANYLDTLRTRLRMSPQEIRRAIRRYLMINKNAQRAVSAGIPSEAEVRHYVRDTEEKVKVRFISLAADKWIDENEPIAEGELQEQFETHKDVDAAESEDGFGYRYPRRVRLQYIAAFLPKIEPQMSVRFEEVKQYWRANKAKYTKIEYVDPPAPTTGPATTGPGSQPSSQPVEKPKPQRVERRKTFSEARADVERELRRRHARQRARQAMRKAAHELLKPWLDLKRDATGYKPIPPKVQDMDLMRSICDRLSEEFGIPLDYRETPLLSEKQLAEHRDLRDLTAEGEGEGAAALSLSEYAFRIPPFFENAAGRETVRCLQFYQTPDAPLTRTQRGRFQVVDGRLVSLPGPLEQIVLFRVVEARDVEAPASLEEVRAKVERDCRIKRAFARLETVAKEIYAVARRLGVEAAYEMFDDVRTKTGFSKPITPVAFARRTKLGGQALQDALLADKPPVTPPTVPEVGASEAFVDACFEMTQEGWSMPDEDLPDTPRTRAASTQPASEPTPVVRWLSLPRMKKWLVLELLELKEVAQDEYESQYRQTAYNTLRRYREFVLRSSWFDPNNIEQRCGFAPIRETDQLPDTSEGIEPAERPEPVRF